MVIAYGGMNHLVADEHDSNELWARTGSAVVADGAHECRDSHHGTNRPGANVASAWSSMTI
jgi:hypothetical protein